jgi:hypothetical protein
MKSNLDNQLNERNRKRLSIYILLGIIIIVSGDTLLFGTNSNSMFINAKYLIHVTLFAGLSMLTLLKNIKINRDALFVYFILILIILLSGFINNELSFGYYYKILIITLSLLITTIIPLSTFIVYYDKIITLLACLSLVGYGSYQLFSGIVRFFPTVTNIANREFYNLFVTYIPNYGYGGVLIRNWGVFREPGVFQMYLVFGLLIQLFIYRDSSKFSVLIYIITIATTFSTTAYIALFITLAAYFLFKSYDTYKKHEKKILFIIIFLVIVTGVVLYSEQTISYLGFVFNKLEDIGHGSTVARVASVTVNLLVFFENPLLGAGFNKLSDIFPIYSLQQTGYFARDNTNMILIQFASHGLIYGVIWILGYWKLSSKLTCSLNQKNTKKLLFFVVFMIIFIGENLTWGFWAYVMLLYGLNKQDEKGYNYIQVGN